MGSSEFKEINEHILEIRYRPNPQVLDFRGELVDAISKHMNLNEWQIVENRIDVFSLDQSIRAFVAFKNAGIVIRNTSLPDYFPNQALKFIRYLFTLKPMSDPVLIERLGVRSRFAIPSNLSFEQLFERYKNKVSVISKDALSAFDATLIDIGFPLNFETKKGKINSSSGPMKKEQLLQFFSHEKSEIFPDVAIFLEFDYWTKPTKPMQIREICNLVKTYADENWQRHIKLNSLIQSE